LRILSQSVGVGPPVRGRGRVATKVGQDALRLIPMLGEDVHNLTNLLKLSDFITPLDAPGTKAPVPSQG